MGELLNHALRKKILEAISPDAAELTLQQQAISTLQSALEEYAKKHNRSYSFIESQGSTGRKQTQLRNTGDIDLFIGLNPEDYEKVLALPHKERKHQLDRTIDTIVDDWLIPAVSSLEITDCQKTYSQHPYLSLTYMGIDTDVLICFDISPSSLAENGPITAVDRTVHHSRYVSEKLTKTLREDVRILKSFARASYVYGDACAVGRMGFTGYALELLVIEGGSFGSALKLLKNLPNTPVDPLNRSKEDLLDIPSFRDDVLFIMDPTDTNRNVASSFDSRSYTWFEKCINKLFQSEIHDVKDLIIEKPIPIEPLPLWFLDHTSVVEFVSDGTHHYTVVRDKLYRLGRKLSMELEKERSGERRFGDSLFEVYFEKDVFSLGIIVEDTTISPEFSRRGPPVGIIEAEKSFRNKHKEVFESEGYLWVTEMRKWTNAFELITQIVANIQIKGLVRKEVTSDVSKLLLNAIHRYILPDDFPIDRARV
ncbi:MAG: hypothetical protein ACTSUB_04920 [Candidatus Thorarchaeota archaeon]